MAQMAGVQVDMFEVTVDAQGPITEMVSNQVS
jgi:hypothetical protein